MTDPTPHRGTPNTPDTPLSARERAFVAEYLIDFDAPRAAQAVGYADGPGIRVTACRLLGEPHIQKAVQRATADRVTRLAGTADNTVREIARICFSDIGDLFDDFSNLKSVKDLPREVRACIASIKVVKKNLTVGDNAVEYVHEIKFWNKPQALELLARHLGLLEKDQQGPVVDVPAFTLPPETPGVRVH